MRRRVLLTSVAASTAALTGCAGIRQIAPMRSTTDRPPADEALVVEETYPVEGTMVNLGVGGTVRNDAAVSLVDCVVAAIGSVGDRTFTAETTRDRLATRATWEWQVTFGDEADEMDSDAVTDISVTTRASYES